MKRVESLGHFHYQIAGDKEEAAAKEFAEAYDFYSRCRNLSGIEFNETIETLRHDIESKYGVKITTELGPA